MATFFVERNFDPAPGEGKWMVTSNAGFGGKISTHRTKQAAINKAKRLSKSGDDVALQGTDVAGSFDKIMEF